MRPSLELLDREVDVLDVETAHRLQSRRDPLLHLLCELGKNDSVANRELERDGGAAAVDLDLEPAPGPAHTGAVDRLGRAADDLREHRVGDGDGAVGAADDEAHLATIMAASVLVE